MGCCGNKRAQLVRRSADAHRVLAPEETPEPVHAPRVFEYTGRTCRTVRGASSGTTYFFARTGDCLEIPYEDAFAMLAEPEILARPMFAPSTRD